MAKDVWKKRNKIIFFIRLIPPKNAQYLIAHKSNNYIFKPRFWQTKINIYN